MSRLVALAIAALTPDVRSPATWLAGVVAVAGSAITWKVVVFCYCDFIRPRLDRFVRDSRLRSGAEDDAITLGILARNPQAFDAHIIGALDREDGRFADAVESALMARALEHGAFLRDVVFAKEIAETERFRTQMQESKNTLDAVVAGLEGVSAAQLAQGRALADMPKLSHAMESMSRTVETVAGSLQGVLSRLETLAVGQGEMRGALDIVQRIVLAGRPPEGVEERRHTSRRAEDPPPLSPAPEQPE